MKKRCLLTAFAAGLVASGSATAFAQDAKGFGRAGELIVSADRLLPVFSFTSGTSTDDSNNRTVDSNVKGSSFGLLWGSESGVPAEYRVHSTPRLGVDYVFVDHWTIGGSIAFGVGFAGSRTVTTKAGGTTAEQSNDTPSTTIFGIAPRAGYILPLADTFAFWPRAGVSYYTISAGQDVTNNTTVTNTANAFSLDLDPQFVFVPIEHLFLQFGPMLNIPLSGSYTQETKSGSTTASVSNDFTLWHFGVSAGLGGWFNLL